MININRRKYLYKKNEINLKAYLSLITKIIFFAILFFIFMEFKPLIIIIIFEILDFLKVILKHYFPFVPLDFVFIFGLTASFYYGFFIGVIIFLLGLINRAILICLESRHILKAVRHLPIFYISTILKNANLFNANFFYIAFSLLVFNYILKYGFKIAKADLEIEKTPFHIINFLLGSVAFYFIYLIYYYFPFLK